MTSVLVVLGLGSCDRGGAATRVAMAARDGASRFVGSEVCRSCHEETFASWEGSHHALAEREVVPAVDRRAFVDQAAVVHGSVTSTLTATDDEFAIRTEGPEGDVRPFPVHRAIGVSPLRQYLIEGEGGRLQVAALSYDPLANDWFDVFGEEDRRPHEWGHWTNRGMVWNAMCADCHNTHLIKGYDAASDTYDTTFAEMGVGCEACHGPGEAHVVWQEEHEKEKGDPTLTALVLDNDGPKWVDTCGSCHARRLELDEVFLAGDSFLDSFYPDLPDLSEIYYADGQVHEEDYEYVSFLMSRMHDKGVQCTNCHDPHTAKPRAEGNDLCLMCHAYRQSDELGPIDPASHSHHDVRQPGGQCVECHMPQTTYMQRHARRDHSLMVPDPLLTKELGIPNACNRCHTDQDVDWTLAAVEEWYGDKMERRQRVRARAVAHAREGRRGVESELVRFVRGETYPAWRAVGAGLLGSWLHSPEVQQLLVELAEDESPLVRAAATRSLGGAGQEAFPLLFARLEDPARAVRFWAASFLGQALPLEHPAAKELFATHRLTADQPAGLVGQAGFWMSRNELDRAIKLLRRGVDWDPSSSAMHQTLAVALSGAGLFEEAIHECKKACELAPEDPQAWFSLGLARGAVDDHAGAAEALARTTELAPDYIRAWYDLGLARNSAGDFEGAITALRRAIALAPDVPDFWFALAAVFRDATRLDEAKDAVRHALQLDPEHPGAKALLESLEPGATGGK